MYKFAIWSFSSHFQNKVLPSIKNNKNIKIKYILTKREDKNLKNIVWLKNKEELLKKNKFYLYFISKFKSL